MTYVLIMWIISGYGVSMVTHDFNGQQTCEAAVTAVQEKESAAVIEATCVSK